MNPKKVMVVGIVIILASGVWWLLNKDGAEITNYPSSNEGIVAFGDSLIQGVGATEGSDFVSVLSERVGQPIENLGISGNTTADGLKRVGLVTTIKPKVAIVLLGGNDFLRRVPEEETYQNLEAIIQEIQSAGTIVVLLGVKSGLITDSFDDDFKMLAKKYGTAYVPNVLDGLIGNPSLMADAIHPNDAGYAIIADKVHPVLKKVLE